VRVQWCGFGDGMGSLFIGEIWREKFCYYNFPEKCMNDTWHNRLEASISTDN